MVRGLQGHNHQYCNVQSRYSGKYYCEESISTLDLTHYYESYKFTLSVALCCTSRRELFFFYLQSRTAWNSRHVLRLFRPPYLARSQVMTLISSWAQSDCMPDPVGMSMMPAAQPHTVRYCSLQRLLETVYQYDPNASFINELINIDTGASHIVLALTNSLYFMALSSPPVTTK